jgi:hypothetical protein
MQTGSGLTKIVNITTPGMPKQNETMNDEKTGMINLLSNITKKSEEIMPNLTTAIKNQVNKEEEKKELENQLGSNIIKSIDLTKLNNRPVSNPGETKTVTINLSAMKPKSGTEKQN